MTTIRADLVDVYLFRRAGRSAEFLQLRRATRPMPGSWQPIMGHIEPGETAAACAVREVGEEAGLTRSDPAWLGFWALQGVHPYFVAVWDAVMLTPRFAVEVAPGWSPTLNAEHDAHRWAAAAQLGAMFLWPGQHAACREILDAIIPGGPAEPAMRA
ncbi:MAG: NUDIX domain-containing protein [Phycisphaerales bacterium]|nr:NUDIX domain-containing protein [Phycisphaerales bacterium]